MDTLIITGWGWKEYAVAAAVALKGLNGLAEVMGMSKRRLPEYFEGEGRKWKRVFLIGMSLGGDEQRLAAALKAMKKTEVVWISSLPMSESQEKLIAPLLKVHQAKGELFRLCGHECGSDRGSGGSLFVRRCSAYADFSTESTWLQRPRQ